MQKPEILVDLIFFSFMNFFEFFMYVHIQQRLL
jgi:hypothetical protein